MHGNSNVQEFAPVVGECGAFFGILMKYFSEGHSDYFNHQTHW
jgi:hypothetical protein